MRGQILALRSAVSGGIAFCVLETRKPSESAGATMNPRGGCSASRVGARHPVGPPPPAIHPRCPSLVLATAPTSPAMGPILPRP